MNPNDKEVILSTAEVLEEILLSVEGGLSSLP